MTSSTTFTNWRPNLLPTPNLSNTESRSFSRGWNRRMAKRGRRSTATSVTDSSVEATVVNFAEDLGRILGTAQRKAEDWMNQRQAITEQLTQIRDTASKYLHQLTGGDASMA